ncbi:MAG TPA: hypothetical protein VFY87_22500, partial [Geminicoccaceae bacterium]|nr:hypothetical protein [Geminicoccaceae bacterium]
PIEPAWSKLKAGLRAGAPARARRWSRRSARRWPPSPPGTPKDGSASPATPSRPTDPQTALGAQAGEARLADVFRKAGFSHFRRAAETPFNLVIEARL